MGEAKRRRLAGEMPDQRPAATMTIPDEIKCDIAKLVRRVSFMNPTGGTASTCAYRAVVGGEVLHQLGVPVTVELGGTVRVGWHETRDVVAFCGPGNCGTMMPYGLVAHYFLTRGSEIIDFSVADWKNFQDEGGEEIALLTSGAKVGDSDAFGNMQWVTTLPDFHWEPREQFEPVLGRHTPDIGKKWYTQFRGPAPPQDGVTQTLTEIANMVRPFVRNMLANSDLPARLKAIS